MKNEEFWSPFRARGTRNGFFLKLKTAQMKNGKSNENEGIRFVFRARAETAAELLIGNRLPIFRQKNRERVGPHKLHFLSNVTSDFLHFSFLIFALLKV